MLINPASKKKNMHVAEYAEMCLFLTELVFPTETTPGSINVTFRPPDSEQEKRLEVALEPDVSDLELVDVNMHASRCQGYDMGTQYNSWFSDCFGFPVKFLYLGGNLRSVRGNVSPTYIPNDAGWMSSIKSNISYYTKSTAVDKGIGFADCAPLLITTLKSLESVNTEANFPPNDQMIMEKFRPNIVLAGAEEPWEEDFWAELTLYPFEDPDRKLGIKLTANCARCTSLNVDFKTGKPGKTESGTVLKKLSKYRRVDKGSPYSPIFGRYGFMMQLHEDAKLSKGDEVLVAARNTQRTKWYWPGLP